MNQIMLGGCILLDTINIRERESTVYDFPLYLEQSGKMGEAAKNVRMETRAEARRQADLSSFVVQDKENFSVYTDSNVEPAQRSPLPVGYPRIPLQDITDVLQPLNVNSPISRPIPSAIPPCSVVAHRISPFLCITLLFF